MIGRTAICCLLCSLNTVTIEAQENLDLRLGIAYNWRNFFFGIQAQYNNFNYKNEYDKVNIYDAYARTSLGVRL